jgi:flagellar motor switch protein FliM
MCAYMRQISVPYRIIELSLIELYLDKIISLDFSDVISFDFPDVRHFMQETEKCACETLSPCTHFSYVIRGNARF